ncbi:MAG: type I-C CRISPR-associated endonuclease Cas1c [Gemmatimonadales bacterium]
MKHHLNTMFVTTDGAYLAKDGAAVVVKVGDEQKLRVPLHNLGGIVCFGRVAASPFLLGACAEAGVAVSFLTEHGRFLAKVQGFTPGNVLLRREQYRRADDADGATAIARSVVSAKLANSRTVLLRATRDYPEGGGRAQLSGAAAVLARCVRQSRTATSLDSLRGIEGEGADTYFGAFDHLLTVQREAFAFRSRSRRPPLDPINALLSFLYAMLGHDARAALEAAGLDPAVGFLHRDRPGRPSLALDLIEEFRAFLADRLALSLVNRRQVTGGGFQAAESGGIRMDDATRRTVIAAYQRRKQETILHPFLHEHTTVGLLIHLQARLLARHLRGDLDAYPAFIWR